MAGVVYNFVLRAWWLWSTVEKSARHFTAIRVQHPQEWSFRHSLTLWWGGRGRRRRELDSNLADVVIFVVCLLPPRRSGVWQGGRRQTTRMTPLSKSSPFPLTQCGSCYVEQRAPATLASATAVAQWWGGRRWTLRTKALARLESNSLLLPSPFLPTALLKSARRATPEDAAHRWWWNIKQISQQ